MGSEMCIRDRSKLIEFRVVLRPTKLFQAAGILTEPPVSEPIEAKLKFFATEIAEPEDDPPGTRLASKEFFGVIVFGFNPKPEKANSVIWVLPNGIKPLEIRCTINKASDCALFFLMIRRPPRSTPLYSSAASDVYKRQEYRQLGIT